MRLDLEAAGGRRIHKEDIQWVQKGDPMASNR